MKKKIIKVRTITSTSCEKCIFESKLCINIEEALFDNAAYCLSNGIRYQQVRKETTLIKEVEVGNLIIKLFK